MAFVASAMLIAIGARVLLIAHGLMVNRSKGHAPGLTTIVARVLLIAYSLMANQSKGHAPGLMTIGARILLIARASCFASVFLKQTVKFK